MKPVSIIMEDAVIIRGIVDLLEAGRVTVAEIAATQHISDDVAQRFCKTLQGAGIIEPILVTFAKRGGQKAEHAWQLTAAYQRGEIALDAEKLAGEGMA